MIGKTHMAVGIATSTAITTLCNINPLSPIVVLPVLIGSLTPDIDIEGSTISHKLTKSIKGVGVFAIVYLILAKAFSGPKIVKTEIGINNTIWIGLAIYILASIISRYTGHRNFSHSILGMIAFTIAIYFIYKPGVIWFAIGYLSHILIDLLNFKGEKILFPLKNEYSLKLCKAGGLADVVICWLSIVFVFIILMYTKIM